jgi:hypothetical protein
MTRNLKVLGLAVVAMLSLSAMVATGAQAAAGELHIGANPAWVTADQTTQHVFTIAGVPIKCEKAHFESTTTTPQSTKHIVFKPSYQASDQVEGETCTLAGVLSRVTTGTCSYTFSGTAEKTATVSVIGCTAGNEIKIEVTASGCTVTVGNQATAGHVTFVKGATNDLVGQNTISGITSVGSATCPVGIRGTITTGTYTGTETIRAFTDVEGKEVAQVNLEAT